MSVVSTVLVLPDAREDASAISELGRRVTALRPEVEVTFRNLSEVRPYPESSPSDHWGGSKVPEAAVWAAALNHIDGAAVVAEARKCDWRHPALVVYQDQDDDRWSYVTIGLRKPEGLGENE